ncbi:hypothetical protein [Methylocella sp.]|uniref:hypothetical protein n=1 Tax=Methylocella sp. TaxID=1978226 RepID=UPI0035AF3BBF
MSLAIIEIERHGIFASTARGRALMLAGAAQLLDVMNNLPDPRSPPRGPLWFAVRRDIRGRLYAMRLGPLGVILEPAAIYPARPPLKPAAPVPAHEALQ